MIIFTRDTTDRYEHLSSIRRTLVDRMAQTQPIDRAKWQGKDAPAAVYELDNVFMEFDTNRTRGTWATFCGADLPWADAHHSERVSGEPLNPAPSYVDWPWHSTKFQEQYKSDKWQNRHNRIEAPFDHTYPERFWSGGKFGVRFPYGDLADVVTQLRTDPFTRQAFLPVWFPEDTGQGINGIRVPCTIGYHFIRNGTKLDMKYTMRACDITRHFHNDLYLAGRLLRWVVSELRVTDRFDVPSTAPEPGTVTLAISNLHLFTTDAWRYKK